MDVDVLSRQLRSCDQELLAIDQQLENLMERREVLKEKRNNLREQLKNIRNSHSNDDDWENKDCTWSKMLHHKLRTIFKIEKLRPYQMSAMNVTLSGHDCILIMPTGGGKSLTYQLPALLSQGVTLVVSPLISLMEDQLMALRNLGINAEMLGGSITVKRQNEILKMMVNDASGLKILYVAPEKLIRSKKFAANLEKMYEKGLLGRIAIDEVHCCSQWGHDFRRDYKKLGILKRQYPRTPVLGLTATATSRVTLDVQKILNIQGCIVFRSSFNRPNLRYQVRPKPSIQAEAIDELVRIILTHYAKQSGIVYCATIKESEDVSAELVRRGIKSRPYHAKLEADYRSKTHKKWLDNSCQVVVATIAFGMGIDKPDVRFVIHYSISKSMENFYQESGRAGRDEKSADCVLFYRFRDIFKLTSMMYEEMAGKENLYSMVAYSIDHKRCRRSIIADHFGERWDSSDCNMMCDNCNPELKGDKADRKEVDITDYCVEVAKILQQAESRNVKMTGLKLLDAWQGKNVDKVKFDFCKSKLSRDDCEHILAFMLLEGYLSETYSITPYAVNSYINIGERAIGDRRVQLDLRVLHPLGFKPSKPSSSRSGMQTNNVWIDPKAAKKPAEVCVVPQQPKNNSTPKRSRNRSVVDQMLYNVPDSDDDLDLGDSSVSAAKKPKCTFEISDDDDEVMVCALDKLEKSL